MIKDTKVSVTLLKTRRGGTAAAVIFVVIALVVCVVCGQLLTEQAMTVDFSRKNIAPCFQYPFGTDWMGRNMYYRTISGLSLSIRIGVLTAIASGLIALGLGMACAVLGRTADTVIIGIIDLVMGIPHILLLLLISFACGRGFWGVVIGISVTHWTSLARVIRAEVLQLRESPYIRIAGKLGKSRWYIVFKHMLPHVMGQFLVGLILLFPHAILHEASITFLGFGLSAEQPAIGVILSESMQYLAMGKWWLALFPGVMLVFIVCLFDFLGSRLREMIDPGSVHK